MSQGEWELSGKADVTDPFHVMPLQGKEEFEKTQKELLEKGNIIRQSKDQLEHQQVRALGQAGGCCCTQHLGCTGPHVLLLFNYCCWSDHSSLPWMFSWCILPCFPYQCYASEERCRHLDPGEEPGMAVLGLELPLTVFPEAGVHGHLCQWLPGGEQVLSQWSPCPMPLSHS